MSTRHETRHELNNGLREASQIKVLVAGIAFAGLQQQIASSARDDRLKDLIPYKNGTNAHLGSMFLGDLLVTLKPEAASMLNVSYDTNTNNSTHNFVPVFACPNGIPVGPPDSEVRSFPEEPEEEVKRQQLLDMVTFAGVAMSTYNATKQQLWDGISMSILGAETIYPSFPRDPPGPFQECILSIPPQMSSFASSYHTSGPRDLTTFTIEPASCQSLRDKLNHRRRIYLYGLKDNAEKNNYFAIHNDSISNNIILGRSFKTGHTFESGVLGRALALIHQLTEAGILVVDSSKTKIAVDEAMKTKPAKDTANATIAVDEAMKTKTAKDTANATIASSVSKSLAQFFGIEQDNNSSAKVSESARAILQKDLDTSNLNIPDCLHLTNLIANSTSHIIDAVAQTGSDQRVIGRTIRVTYPKNMHGGDQVLPTHFQFY